MSEFVATMDHGTLLSRRHTNSNLVRFHGRHVHLKISASDGTKERFFLESGQVVLWRNGLDNSLSLAFFDREAKNDLFPKIIIPLGLVLFKNCAYLLTSGDGPPRGKFLIQTSCSVDMTFTTKPMDVVVYMNAGDAQKLDEAMMDAVQKWPRQLNLAYRKNV
jgi:hypothetical protein